MINYTAIIEMSPKKRLQIVSKADFGRIFWNLRKSSKAFQDALHKGFFQGTVIKI